MSNFDEIIEFCQKNIENIDEFLDKNSKRQDGKSWGKLIENLKAIGEKTMCEKIIEFCKNKESAKNDK